MSKIFTITKGEFFRYFTSPLAYVYLVCFLLLNSSFALYFGGIFTQGNASLKAMFEVLRRQGLFAGIWCLNPEETLSAGQNEEIDRVYAMYPDLNDDAFVKEFLAGEEA